MIHHAIVRVVEPIFERRIIEDSFACRRGKGTHAAMRRAVQFARRFPHALKCDVQKYFPSIDHEVLFTQLARVIADQRLLTLIRSILDTHADDVRQPAVLELEQQRPDEREQQRRIPRGKPLKEAGAVASSHVLNRPDSLGCQKPIGPRRAQGLPDHPACPAFKPGRQRSRLVPRRVASPKAAAKPISRSRSGAVNDYAATTVSLPTAGDR